MDHQRRNVLIHSASTLTAAALGLPGIHVVRHSTPTRRRQQIRPLSTSLFQ